MNYKIAVVIPSYKVRNHLLDVLAKIGPEVSKIYVVDDCCPHGSGDFVTKNCLDPRVTVLMNSTNQGVGGAVLTGYQQAIQNDMDIIVKLDGDGQMDPALIPLFVEPLVKGDADYTKGNRFFDLESVRTMPKTRLLGNAVLSFMTKFSSGYWNIFDPTNGYTAIHANVANLLPMEKISRRYFFESDMLFRLNTLRAVVVDIPMEAQYGDEESNLKISKILFEFLFKHCRNFLKRIFYNYYLRDLSLASFELPISVFLILFGASFGFYNWVISTSSGIATSAGTVMLSALPILVGLQFLLAFVGYDIALTPSRPIHNVLKSKRRDVQ